MKCGECEAIETRKHLIYEDSIVAAVLSSKPAVAGALEVFPKEHHPILEKVPDDVIGKMFAVANKLAAACFEVLGAEGTNIVIKNGLAAGQVTSHMKLHVLPRTENDGLNLQWQSSKANEEELNTTQLMLKEQLEKETAEKAPEKEEQKKEQEEISEESYLLKQLERIP